MTALAMHPTIPASRPNRLAIKKTTAIKMMGTVNLSCDWFHSSEDVTAAMAHSTAPIPASTSAKRLVRFM